MLGFASTWPQAACALPTTDQFDWEVAWVGCLAGEGASRLRGAGRRVLGCAEVCTLMEGCLGVARLWCWCRPNSSSQLYALTGDRPLRTPMEQLVIYEMHVRGFTRDDSSRVGAPGMEWSAFCESL